MAYQIEAGVEGRNVDKTQGKRIRKECFVQTPKPQVWQNLSFAQ